MPWSSILSWNWTVKTNLAKIQVIHVWRRYQPVQLAPCACYRKCMSLITDQQQKLVCTFMPWFSLSVTINAARRKVCRSWRTVIKKSVAAPTCLKCLPIDISTFIPSASERTGSSCFPNSRASAMWRLLLLLLKRYGGKPQPFYAKASQMKDCLTLLSSTSQQTTQTICAPEGAIGISSVM